MDVVLDMVPIGSGPSDKHYSLGVDYIQGSLSVGAKVEASIPKRKWTILVYMEAANDLEEYGITDLNELEMLPWIDGTGHGDVNCVALVSTSGTILEKGGYYHLAQDDDPNRVSTTPYQIMHGGADMSNPANLESLITTGKMYYPADKYALVIWNHGSGFRNRGICYGPWGSMSVEDCANAIRNQGGVDLLVLDACYMGSVESLSEFSDVASRIVASENTVPGHGMKYDAALAPLLANPDMGADSLGQSFITSYSTTYGTGDTARASLSLYRGGQGSDASILSAIDNLARAFIDDRNGSQTGGIFLEEKDVRKDLLALRAQIQSVRKQLGDSGVDPKYESYKDIENLATKVKATFQNSEVQAACNAIVSALNTWRTMTFLGQNTPNEAGTSLWFPNRSDFKKLLPDFLPLRIAKQTQWDEFLKALYAEPLYRIEMSYSHDKWKLYPFFSDTFWEDGNTSGSGEHNDFEGYTRDFEWDVLQLDKNWDITEAAADKTYSLWVSYDDIPTDWEVDYGWVKSGPITIKVFKQGIDQPIHTLTGDLRCRAGTSYTHWKVLKINPKTDAITIIDEYFGIGF